MPERLARVAVRAITPVLRAIGYRPTPIDRVLEDGFLTAYSKCQPYSLTSVERMYALFKAVQYLVYAGVPGDIVECGVWKGGSAMMVAYALGQLGQTDRQIRLYDTFSGMVQPAGIDVEIGRSRAALPRWTRENRSSVNRWCFAPYEEVERNMRATGYPMERVTFVRGPVESTLPREAPARISLLRLDTDWYESTKHELTHLYPRLSEGGVLIVDDYGHWAGAQKAVDEYFSTTGRRILLNRIDYSGRIGIKQEPRLVTT